MVRWIRDVNELSTRKLIVAGIINTALGVGLMFLMDGSMGVKPETTAFHVVIMLVASVLYLYWYGKIMQWRARKAKKRNDTQLA